jgi:hypothetical protein
MIFGLQIGIDLRFSSWDGCDNDNRGGCDRKRGRGRRRWGWRGDNEVAVALGGGRWCLLLGLLGCRDKLV